MRKTLLIIFCFTSFMASAQANSIVVTASGATEAEAKNNAFVAAIEQTVGVMVSTELLIENGDMIKDRIKTHSNGIIKTYRTLNSSKVGEQYYVTIRAEVSQEVLTRELEIITGTKIDIDGASVAANLATKQKLYDNLVREFPERAEELVTMLLASCELSITNVEFDYKHKGSEIPFVIRVAYDINQDTFDNAMEEIDKVFNSIGAEHTTRDRTKYGAEAQKNTVQVYDNSVGYSRSYIFSDATYELVKKYFLNKLGNYSRKLTLIISSGDNTLLTQTDSVSGDTLYEDKYPLIKPFISEKNGRNFVNTHYDMKGTINQQDIEKIDSISVSFPTYQKDVNDGTGFWGDEEIWGGANANILEYKEDEKDSSFLDDLFTSILAILLVFVR